MGSFVRAAISRSLFEPNPELTSLCLRGGSPIRFSAGLMHRQARWASGGRRHPLQQQPTATLQVAQRFETLPLTAPHLNLNLILQRTNKSLPDLLHFECYLLVRRLRLISSMTFLCPLKEFRVLPLTQGLGFFIRKGAKPVYSQNLTNRTALSLESPLPCYHL